MVERDQHLCVLLLAAGPALYASMRKLRNTPGWPFLVGRRRRGAVLDPGAGLARGGVEHAWLPFFPWLDGRRGRARAAGRRAGPTPLLLLVAGGALTAVIVEAVLVTPGDKWPVLAELTGPLVSQASSTSSSRSSLQASSSPSGSRIARSGLSASTAPGSWVTSTIAPG